MNINGNHCAVYKPINPGLKYSVFDGVLSVIRRALDPRRVINPINHAAHGLILFLSPLTFLFGPGASTRINRRRRSITGHVTIDSLRL